MYDVLALFKFALEQVVSIFVLNEIMCRINYQLNLRVQLETTFLLTSQFKELRFRDAFEASIVRVWLEMLLGV